jgi:predicted TIM-barrel fold metal-dependent hydrolase
MPEIADTHTHVVSNDAERYPLDSSVGADQDWHRDRPLDADGMMTLAERASVRNVVFVQSLSCHGYDNRYALDSARRHEGRTVAVGALDPGDPAASTRLRDETLGRGMQGVRLSAHGNPATFDDDAMRTVVAVASGLGVPVVLIGGAAHLRSVATLARAFPSVQFVVDHCGFADLSDPGRLTAAPGLLALADEPNVVCKVTSINLQATPDPRALWSTLVARFGADRLVWGSDYPHSDGPGYDALVVLGRASTDHLGAEAQACVLGDTARRVWSSLV